MNRFHKAQLALKFVPNLATPTETTVRLLELVLDPAPSPKELTALVRTDPGLALEVLRSQAPSERRRRFSLHLSNAVDALGVDALRELALRLPVDQIVPTGDGTAGAACSLHARKHAVACGAAALAFARASGYLEPETAFTGGLLASIGSLTLWQLHEQSLRGIRAEIPGHDTNHLLELEREACGMDHSDLAIALVEAWKLPYELRDILEALHCTPEELEQMGANGSDVQLATLVRAGFHAAHEAGFPLVSGLSLGAPAEDVARLYEAVDMPSLLEGVREAVGRASELACPSARTTGDVMTLMSEVHRQLQRRLVETDRRLNSETSVNEVLHYGLSKLGQHDTLPGLMLKAMEAIGFARIACLEVDSNARKLIVQRSFAASGSTRIPENSWVPLPADRNLFSKPSIVTHDPEGGSTQLLLELCGVSFVVVAPLAELDSGKKLLLCGDRGPTGQPPTAIEERALGIVAEQVSLLMQYERVVRDKERMATQDPLTGAATRRRLMERLEFLIGQSERTGLPFTLLIMDLDHFKRFNDTMGHQTGDRLLQDLVGILTGNVRKGDLVARYGGEEFVVLLSNCELDGAVGVADMLRQRVFDYGTLQLESYGGMQVSISMGAAQWRRGETALSLIGRADAALYEAKHGGRNRVVRAVA